MKPLTKLNRATVKTVQRDMAAAAATVAAKYGLTVQPAGASFSETDVTMRIKLAVADDDHAIERKKFAQLAFLVGWNDDVYGREFTARGTTYRVVGINRKARKNAVTIERVSDHKRFRCSVRATGIPTTRDALVDYNAGENA